MSTARIAIFGLSLSACVQSGPGLQIPEDSAISLVVSIRGEVVHIRPLSPDLTGGLPLSSGDEESYLLTVPEAMLLAFSPSVDASRWAEITPRLVEESAPECREIGTLIRLDAGEGSHLQIEAKVVGALHQIDLQTEQVVLTAVESWPPLLQGLVLEVPIRDPCPPLEAEVQPFASKSPIVGLGERLGETVLNERSAQEANIHRVEYLDDEHAMISSSGVLAVIRRGQAFEDAVKVGVSDPGFLATPMADQKWEVLDFDLSSVVDGRREGYLVARLYQGPAPTRFVASAVIRFTVTSSAISGFELRHLEPARPEDSAGNSLGNIAIRPGGGFGAVGPGLIVSAEGNGPVTVGRTGQINAADVVHLPAPLPPSLIQGRNSDWWLGRLEFVQSLRREVATAVFTGVGGSTRLLPSPTGPRIISCNGLPQIHERIGDDDWRTHPWWLPVFAAACVSDTPRCGRAAPQGLSPIRDFATPEGGGIIHAFENCPFLFRTDPLDNGCSRALPVDWSSYMIDVNDDTAIFGTSTRGKKILIGGLFGLLVEVTLQ